MNFTRTGTVAAFIGAALVSDEIVPGRITGLREVAKIVRHGHERWDGGGYPDGLKRRFHSKAGSCSPATPITR